MRLKMTGWRAGMWQHCSKLPSCSRFRACLISFQLVPAITKSSLKCFWIAYGVSWSQVTLAHWTEFDSTEYWVMVWSFIQEDLCLSLFYILCNPLTNLVFCRCQMSRYSRWPFQFPQWTVDYCIYSVRIQAVLSLVALCGQIRKYVYVPEPTASLVGPIEPKVSKVS